MPTYGARRVPGLRREEIAMLAGVSSTYYTRLEQGQNINASESVLEALAKALALTPAERAHLFNLARPSKLDSGTAPEHDCVRPSARRLIQSMHDIPAVIMGRRSEVLGWNDLGHLLVASHLPFDAPDRVACRPNLTRMLFLDAATHALYPRWADEAARAVASLRVVLGRFPDDAELAELVQRLERDSAEFRALWQSHPVENCVSGVKFFDHPLVGPLELDFEALVVPDGTGHRVLMYNARPGSASASALEKLKALVGSGTPNADERAVS
jgi:transcriptional regulator with XRE-family HTH domain